MNRTRVAPLVAGLALAMYLATLGMAAATSSWHDFPPNDGGMAIGFTLVGTILTARRAGGWIGPLLLLQGCGATLVCFSEVYPNLGEPGAGFLSWLLGVTWIPGVALIAPLVLWLPDGRLPSPRWRWLPWTSAGVAAVLIGVAGLMGRGAGDGAVGTRPLGVIPYAVGEPVGLALFFVLLALAVVALVGLARRWRRAVGTERLQLRWIALTSIFGIVLLVVDSAVLPEDALGAVCAFTSTISIPAGIGIAVVRYRLYDLDRLVSRTVTYAVVTGLLVGVYVGLVTAVSALVPHGSSHVGVALATLAVAALFVPVRRTTQRMVDRRFNRSRYDAQRTVDAFAGRLRTEVDPSVLHADLLDVLARTVAPAHATLWVAR